MVAKTAAPLLAKRWDVGPAIAILAVIGVALMRWPLPYEFAAGEHRAGVAEAGAAMNANPLTTLFVHFATLSLFAVGGANAAMPEMHRIAVEGMRWMTDKQFADMFAISPISPGPNVAIVTLIGFHVAGIAIVAGLVTAAAAFVGFATRLNPLWVFAAGGVLGLFGLV